MIVDVKVAVGLDLHKKFILATVLEQSGQMSQERFDRTKEGLFSLMADNIESIMEFFCGDNI